MMSGSASAIVSVRKKRACGLLYPRPARTMQVLNGIYDSTGKQGERKQVVKKLRVKEVDLKLIYVDCGKR